MMREHEIERAYDAIALPPDMEGRIQRKLERRLDAPLQGQHVHIRKPRRIWPAVLATAAALLLLIGAAMTARWVQQRRGETAVIIPAADPGDAVTVPPEAEAPKTNADTESLALYAEVLRHYHAVLAEELDGSQGISSLCRNYYGDSIGSFYGNSVGTALQRIGYALEDLNGDGVPELLTGCVFDGDAWENAIFDLYTLRDGSPVKLAESFDRIVWYDLGEGLFLRESSGGAGRHSWSLFGYDEELTEKETLSFDAEKDEPWYLYVAPVNGEYPALDPFMTQEEADAWQAEYCAGYVRHRFTPFASLELPELPDDAPPLGPVETLKEEELAQLNWIMLELSRREEPFALADYAPQQPDGVVLLMEQIERYSRERTLLSGEIRGILYGRLDLDGASAERYAALLGWLYRQERKSFLLAWDEAGRPSLLLNEVTGDADPVTSALKLAVEWELYYGELADRLCTAEDERPIELSGPVEFVTVDGQTLVLVTTSRGEEKRYYFIPVSAEEGGYGFRLEEAQP